MPFTVRIAEEKDINALAYLNQTALGYTYSPKKTAEKLKIVSPDAAQVVFVAEMQGAVIGYIHAAIYDTLYFDTLVDIRGLAVDANCRRQGVGRTLLNAAESWAKQQGACGIRLASGAARTGAHAFYAACGYENSKSQKRFIKYFGNI